MKNPSNNRWLLALSEQKGALISFMVNNLAYRTAVAVPARNKSVGIKHLLVQFAKGSGQQTAILVRR